MHPRITESISDRTKTKSWVFISELWPPSFSILLCIIRIWWLNVEHPGVSGWLSRLRSDSWFQLRSWSQGCGIKPNIGLCAEGGACLRFSRSLPLSFSPTLTLSWMNEWMNKWGTSWPRTHLTALRNGFQRHLPLALNWAEVEHSFCPLSPILRVTFEN